MKLPIVVVAALLAGPAGAQSLVPGPNQTGRYEMQPIEGGVARLDTITGDVSLCRVEGGTLRCRPSEDENAAAAPNGDEERARPRDGDGDDFADARPRRDPDAADEAEIDRQLDKTMDRLKRAFRAFNDIAREFENEKQRDPHTPDRT